VLCINKIARKYVFSHVGGVKNRNIRKWCRPVSATEQDGCASDHQVNIRRVQEHSQAMIEGLRKALSWRAHFPRTQE
jgi:hypothetical protein